MKKFVVGFFVLALTAVMFLDVFAANTNETNRRHVDFEELDLTNEEIPVIAESKVLVAASSILSDEVANAVLYNSGNYTFFKKQGSSSGDVEDRAGLTMWIKALGGMEKLDMKDYDDEIETYYYGAVLGLDTDRQYSDSFDATYGIFASYVGSEFKDKDFDDDKIKQNGGFVGVRGNWYVGKLFFGAVLDYGMIQNKVEASSGTSSGTSSEEINTQSIGLSAKVGYNFEVAERSFTIQPNVVFNANYLIVEDYDSIIDVWGEKTKIENDNIRNIAIAPGLKLAKTLGKCWIISAEGKYVFVSSDGDIKLATETIESVMPESYYKNYVNCGLGIEKIWGYTVLHVKVNKNFIGRDGYSLNAGIEFKF